MILLIDNYDSFTYNLAALLAQFDEVRVIRNDQITMDQAKSLNMDRIVLSPGPGGPNDAGLSLEIIKEFGGKIPLLGVCLGHQCIGQAFGASVSKASRPIHGKASLIYHKGTGLFKGIPSPFRAGRYHSLSLASPLPSDLEAMAFSEDDEIMAIQHRIYPIFGVQFHPESILTENGRLLLKNFCSIPQNFEKIGKGSKRDDETFQKHLERIAAGKTLSPEEMEEAMDQILSGGVSDLQIASFLCGLKSRGETVEEISAAARVLRRKAVRVETGVAPLLDTCGTGGDGAETFNLSTAAAFVAAGAGIPVAKHGNRAVSSRCGSADLLEALGLSFPDSSIEVKTTLKAAGMAFLYAPSFHSAMKNVAEVRKKLKIRTLFNLLGPLINPAAATCQLVGVYSPEWVRPFAEVLRNFGVEGALVVHGFGGLDEVSPGGPTKIAELRRGQIEEYTLVPEDAGLSRIPIEEIKGGTPEENARLLEALLHGAGGPLRDAVLLNGAAALIASGRVFPTQLGNDPKRWKLAVQMARESLDSGKAAEVLTRMVALSKRKQPVVPLRSTFLTGTSVTLNNRLVPSFNFN